MSTKCAECKKPITGEAVRRVVSMRAADRGGREVVRTFTRHLECHQEVERWVAKVRADSERDRAEFALALRLDADHG